jgi:hypothetical protein
MIVGTLNSIYTVDFGLSTIERMNVADNNTLRRDEESLKIISLTRPEIGKRWETYVDVREDGVPTMRVTSTVTRLVGVEEWDEWNALITTE